MAEIDMALMWADREWEQHKTARRAYGDVALSTVEVSLLRTLATEYRALHSRVESLEMTLASCTDFVNQACRDFFAFHEDCSTLKNAVDALLRYAHADSAAMFNKWLAKGRSERLTGVNNEVG